MDRSVDEHVNDLKSQVAELRSVNAEVECLLREALKARGIKLGDPRPSKRGRPPKGSR